MAFCILGGLLSAKGKISNHKNENFADTEAKRHLRELHDQQTHKFWRDFDK